MSSSLASNKLKGDTYPRYLSKISGLSEADIARFFLRFQVDEDAPYYEGVVTNAIDALKNPTSVRLLSGLKAYQGAIKEFDQFSSLGINDWLSPSENENRHIALGILSIVECPEGMSDERNTYALLWSCMILAILRCDVESAEDRGNLAKAARELRQSGPDSRDITYQRLAELTHELVGVGGPHSLFSEINRLSHKGHKLYRYIRKVLPLVDLTEVEHEKKKSSVSDLHKVEMYFENQQPALVSAIQVEAQKDDVEDFVLFNDPVLDAPMPQGPDRKSRDALKKLKIKSTDIKELEGELKQDASLIRRFNRYMASAAFKSDSHLMTSTSLYSSFERAKLTDSLLNPQRYGCSSSSALLVALSITTVRTTKETLEMTVGPDGDITPEGNYHHRIPNIPKSAVPDDGDEELYVHNVADKSGGHLTLQLPMVVIKNLSMLYSPSMGTVSINELLDNGGVEPGNLAKEHINKLNKLYGQRFSANRIRNQLRSYITARLNDPCITYALTANEKVRVPTALYYRAIPTQHLLDVYKECTEEYFIC